MRRRVVVAGGGVAALEAVLALRDLAGDRLEIDLFSPKPDFVYLPNTVGRPFDLADITRYNLVDLSHRAGVRFHLDRIVSLDADASHVTTARGAEIAFDYLIAAQGVERSSPLRGAADFGGGEDREAGQHFRDLIAGRIQSLALTAPRRQSWDLPLYELALLAEASLSPDLRSKARLVIVTPEERPMGIFGVAVGHAVEELLAERGIETVLGAHAVDFDGRQLSVVPTGRIAVEAVISLPALSGRRIEGLAHDEDGFVPIDDHCRVINSANIFAAGDVTSFPVKQGGIATQQADVAAGMIAADLGELDREAPAFHPILRGVMWTGKEKLYLEGWLGGGHGESSKISREPLWPGGEDKIVGRYLSPFLEG